MSYYKMPRVWEGGDCYIIGGGYSIVKEFGIPDDIVEKVKKGTMPIAEYSPYMSYLHDKHVIGVNAAFKIGNWIDILFFGDKSFYDRYAYDINKFPNLKVTCSLPTQDKLPGIKKMKKVAGNMIYGITTNPEHLSWNTNSGGSAINLAVHTGVKRIFLLGFDMKEDDGNKHWHRLYGLVKNSQPYKRHIRCFPFIAEDARKLGVEIINVSPDSKIHAFPKISLKELL